MAVYLHFNDLFQLTNYSGKTLFRLSEPKNEICFIKIFHILQ